MRTFGPVASSLALLAALATSPMGCGGQEDSSVPILPPLTISSPDANGEVTVDGVAEPQAIILGFNEDLGLGVITTSADDGGYRLVLEARVGDTIAVWQRVGTDDSPPRFDVVPGP